MAAATLGVRGETTTRSAATAGPPALDGWALCEPLGEGSLTRVVAARPVDAPQSPAAYAVKILRAELEHDPRAVACLQREAKVGRRVHHRHLAPVLAAHVARPPYFLVLPRLAGVTLQARLEQGPLDPPAALWIARQAAEALGALAAAGWRHGDVSPANLFLSPTGHVTLFDLGFATPRGELGSVLERPVMGTIAYMAPELLTSALAGDLRSDLYGLGAVLYEMLAGRPPFAALDLAELATCHRQDQLPDVRKLAPDLPREAARLVHELLAKEPLRRPQTAEELVERLIGLEIGMFGRRAGVATRRSGTAG